MIIIIEKAIKDLVVDKIELDNKFISIKEDEQGNIKMKFSTGKWNQYIKFPNKVDEKNIYKVDIEVYCDCPSYTFGGYKYLGTINGYNFSEYEERRPPKKSVDKYVCKHLESILGNFSNFVFILRDFLKDRR